MNKLKLYVVKIKAITIRCTGDAVIQPIPLVSLEGISVPYNRMVKSLVVVFNSSFKAKKVYDKLFASFMTLWKVAGVTLRR